MNELTRVDEQTQLELFNPVEITRPDVNIGRAAGRIFASPYAKDLDKPKMFVWEVEQKGEKARASMTITPVVGKKRPTTTTLKVYLALTQIWEQSGKPEDGEIIFSTRQLAHMLRWRWSGKNVAQRIKDHLSILKGTQIDWLRSYTSKGETRTKVQEMNIIQDRSYVERSNSLTSELFSSQQTVILHPHIVKNMLDGHTKPFNSDALLAIKDETAGILYALLDNYLSRKRHWERRSIPLLRDELFLEGKRYGQRFARHERLKRFVEVLDGVELSTGKLHLCIEETADGKDWKLIAKKVPRIQRKGRVPPKLANPKEDIPFIIAELIEGLSQLGAVGRDSEGVLSILARWYSHAFLRDVLAVLKADYRGSIKKSPIRAYVYLVHVHVHERRMDWIKDCGPQCPHRPEKRQPLFAKSD